MDLILHKRSHHFLITNLSKVGVGIAANFARQFIEYDLVPNPGGRGFHKEAARVYACANRDLSEFRFHINCLPDFLKILSLRGMVEKKDYLIHTTPLAEPPEVNFQLQSHWKDREHQIPAIEYILNRQPWPAKFVSMQTGKGKALTKKAKIRIPGGWTTMGEIDQKQQIMNPDGTVQYVEYTTDYVDREMFTVRFADGRESVCCDDHLWEVYDEIGQRHVVTTQWLREETDQELRSFFIQLIEPEQAPETESHADRYEYGQAIAAIAKMARRAGFEVEPELMTGSIKQRQQVLRGMFANQHTFESVRVGSFVTDCEKLVESVRQMCWSLGCAAYCTEKEGSYHVTVQAQYMGQSVYLPFDSIVYEGLSEARCISVSGQNRLYITDNYLPTHNSYIGMRASQELGVRTAYFFANKYTEKWLEDFKSTYVIDDKDIRVIKGSGALLKLCKQAMEGKPIEKIIVVSNMTFQSWIKTYEKDPEKYIAQGWPFAPDEFFEKVGIGFRIIDELHEFFHLNFKIDLYTHVKDSASFSATLEDKNPFKIQMYELMHPLDTRYDGGAYDAYVATKAKLYRFARPSRIMSTEYGDTKYSHHAVERSILKDKETLLSYFQMIESEIRADFLDIRDPGERAVVFFSSIAMCSAFTAYMRRTHPQLITNRYVEDDEYEDLISGDIAVTTILSAGTGVDIPMLRAGFMTTGVDSPKANLQAFGRTRKMASGNVPRFVYFSCEDIPKSMEYHRNKVELLTPRSVSFVISKHEQLLGFTER